MKRYAITWEIDVWADSPLDAAKEALRMQRNAESLATVFDVAEISETLNQAYKSERIDLAEDQV